MIVTHAVFCSSQGQVSRVEAELCSTWGGIPPQSVADCPYVLVGEPQEIADKLTERQERYGLAQIELQEQTDGVEFYRKVLPLLQRDFKVHSSERCTLIGSAEFEQDTIRLEQVRGDGQPL
jgi:hypothetical protein